MIDKLEWVFIILAGLVLIVTLYGGYQESNNPNFELTKKHWECTSEQNKMNLIFNGKNIIPINNTICIKYERVDYD